MISNTPKTIIVDGASYIGAAIKRSDTGNNETDIQGSLFYIANGKGSYYGGSGIIVTGEIKGYFLKKILLHEASVYDITGIATPGDRLVYISSEFDPNNIEILKNSVINSAYANKQGNFTFKNIHYPGTVYLWMSQLAQDAVDASITYELSIVDYNPEIGEFLTYSFNEPENEDYTNPKFTIKGTCSSDVETVYISKADNAIGVAYLMRSMISSTTPENGSFEIECSGEYDENYIVWGLSKRNGNLNVSSIKVSGDKSTCLSGDTMITMADGSLKRMDKICAGDIVLSKDGTSRVHTIRRGSFSDSHTLYYFSDGTIIDETHPHRFYNVDQGFWQRLENWNIGDHAIKYNGEKVSLTFIEILLDEKTEMFGIWTDDGTYYANGLLSGAASCNKELLADASAEQAIDMVLSLEEEMLVDLMGLGGILP